MEIIKGELEGLLIIRPDVYKDERGYFFEAFSRDKFKNAGVEIPFVQDNESKSRKGVVRGMHLQTPPYEQGKLVRVISGSVLDVAVDIRKSSPTYGKWQALELSAKNKLIFWIPPGFAHGFSVLEDETIFFYKCTNPFNKEAERCFQWNDPDLNIDWKIKDPVVSARDGAAESFREFVSPF